MRQKELKKAQANQIIKDLCLAINSIEPFYYSVPKVEMKGTDLIVDDDEAKEYERRFVARLNVKYEEIMKELNPTDYLDTNSDFEVIKKYIYSDKNDQNIKDTYHRLEKKIKDPIEFLTTIPDFFIHKGQDNKEHLYQKLVVEVKTTKTLSEMDFFQDFFKLNVYVDKYNFQNAVFVIINSSYDNIVSKIESYLKQWLFVARHDHDKLYCLIKEDHESVIRLISFE